MVDLNIVIGILGMIATVVSIGVSVYYHKDKLTQKYIRYWVKVGCVMVIVIGVMCLSLVYAPTFTIPWIEVIQADLFYLWITILYTVIILLTWVILLDRIPYSYIHIILLDLVNKHISILDLEKKASEEYRFYKDGKEIPDNERENYLYESCYIKGLKYVLLANEVDEDKKIIHVLKLEDLEGKSTNLIDALNSLAPCLFDSKKE